MRESTACCSPTTIAQELCYWGKGQEGHVQTELRRWFAAVVRNSWGKDIDWIEGGRELNYEQLKNKGEDWKVEVRGMGVFRAFLCLMKGT